MSRKEKILQRFLLKPKDFTYDELSVLLNGFGYKEIKTGKTSGSRVAFINYETTDVIRLHKPHPDNILKKYQIDLIIDELVKIGVINER